MSRNFQFSILPQSFVHGCHFSIYHGNWHGQARPSLVWSFLSPFPVDPCVQNWAQERAPNMASLLHHFYSGHFFFLAYQVMVPSSAPCECLLSDHALALLPSGPRSWDQLSHSSMATWLILIVCLMFVSKIKPYIKVHVHHCGTVMGLVNQLWFLGSLQVFLGYLW